MFSESLVVSDFPCNCADLLHDLCVVYPLKDLLRYYLFYYYLLNVLILIDDFVFMSKSFIDDRGIAHLQLEFLHHDLEQNPMRVLYCFNSNILKNESF